MEKPRDFELESNPELGLFIKPESHFGKTVKRYSIWTADGEQIGSVEIALNIRKKTAGIADVRIFKPNQGIGKKLYKYMGEVLNKEGYTLEASDNQISAEIKHMWNSLHKAGIAKKKDDGTLYIG